MLTIIAAVVIACFAGEPCLVVDLREPDSRLFPLVCGDVTLSGALTGLDSRIIQQCAAEIRDCDRRIADVDGDGKVTAFDARRVAQAAGGVIEPESLTCPFAP